MLEPVELLWGGGRRIRQGAVVDADDGGVAVLEPQKGCACTALTASSVRATPARTTRLAGTPAAIEWSLASSQVTMTAHRH